LKEDLTGRVVVITGGSSGIGRAAALAFARSGARVVIAARGVERGEEVLRDIRAAKGEGIFVRTDVSRADQVRALVETAVRTYGRLDCALNNAGIIPDRFERTADYDEGVFDRTIAVNLKGVWLCMRYEILAMLGQNPPGGSIVNTSSLNGLGGVPLGSLYSAAKAGVLGLTKSAALEYGGQGIRVNALVPGAIDTPMQDDSLRRVSGGDPETRKRIEEHFRQFIALGRVGRPEEAAEAAVWLCSDAASYVTGHSLIVDGGASASMR
jgi:NAD(P)-dependent dehydrogenase (short-subunit alcohol dehydrogenase family)